MGAPRYTLPAIASLALGIGAATAVFAVFSAMALRPLPFPAEQELVQPGLEGIGGSVTGQMDALSAPFAADFRQLESVFQSFALHQSGAGRLTGLDSPKRIALELVSAEFFDTLGIQAELGRTFTARGSAPDATGVVVLRHGFWLDSLGGAPILGQTILVDDQPQLVLGIVADEQALPSYAEMWKLTRFPEQGPRFAFWLKAVARLAPGLSLDAARQRFSESSAALQIHSPDGGLVTGSLTSLRDTLVSAQRHSLALLLAAVVAFLLLACSNVAALLATRASVRLREHALRSALGATRSWLVRQSVLEALLLALIGGLLGLGLALLGMRFANQTYQEVLTNTPARLDPRVVAAFLGLLLISALTAALAPALYAKSAQPMDALRGDGRSSGSRGERRLREALVALQVAATLALLVNAGLLVRSVQALLHVDLGFSPERVVAAAVLAPLDAQGRPTEFWGRGPDSPEAQALYLARWHEAKSIAQRVHERLHRLPGVTAACVASDLPFDWFAPAGVFQTDAGAESVSQATQLHYFSPGCLETLGIPLRSGRDFTAFDDAADPEGPWVALVNQEFARSLLGLSDAVGHRFRAARPGAPWIEIVGMVGDTLESDVTAPRGPAVYIPLVANPLALSNESSTNFAVAVRAAGEIEPLFGALPRAVEEVTRNAPVFIVERLQDRVEQSFWQQAALQRVLVAFSVSAVILAAIGLFGVTAYSVAERSAEIGIRRALGASRGAIRRMILRETGLVVLIGMALGVWLCRLGRGVLEALLFGVSANDLWTYGYVCLGILALAAAAALLAARGAATISPSRALAQR